VPRLVATVQGRVQGVAFRYFVQTQGRRLGLSGHVRNRADGYSVEVCAEGRREDLELLLGRLQVGPPGARVVRVDAAWPSETGEFTGFTIRT